MIISHRYRFIFIKTRKTAGTSVEIALSRYCGPEDVLTPTTPEDELTRADLGIFPRHYARWPLSMVVGSGFNLHEYWPRANKLIGKLGMRRFRQHGTAAEVARSINPSIWNDYYKFTIERDPLDRIVSRFYWDLSNGRCRSLEDFFERSAFDSNFDIYAIDGQPAVDKIIRFDQLAEEVRDVCSHLGIPYDGWMPRAKSGLRRDKKSWRDLLNEAQIRRVVQESAREYEVMRQLGAPIPPEAEQFLAGLGADDVVVQPAAASRMPPAAPVFDDRDDPSGDRGFESRDVDGFEDDTGDRRGGGGFGRAPRFVDDLDEAPEPARQFAPEPAQTEPAQTEPAPSERGGWLARARGAMARPVPSSSPDPDWDDAQEQERPAAFQSFEPVQEDRPEPDRWRDDERYAEDPSGFQAAGEPPAPAQEEAGYEPPAQDDPHPSQAFGQAPERDPWGDRDEDPQPHETQSEPWAQAEPAPWDTPQPVDHVGVPDRDEDRDGDRGQGGGGSGGWLARARARLTGQPADEAQAADEIRQDLWVAPDEQDRADTPPAAADPAVEDDRQPSGGGGWLARARARLSGRATAQPATDQDAEVEPAQDSTPWTSYSDAPSDEGADGTEQADEGIAALREPEDHEDTDRWLARARASLDADSSRDEEPAGPESGDAQSGQGASPVPDWLRDESDDFDDDEFRTQIFSNEDLEAIETGTDSLDQLVGEDAQPAQGTPIEGAVTVDAQSVLTPAPLGMQAGGASGYGADPFPDIQSGGSGVMVETAAPRTDEAVPLREQRPAEQAVPETATAHREMDEAARSLREALAGLNDAPPPTPKPPPANPAPKSEASAPPAQPSPAAEAVPDAKAEPADPPKAAKPSLQPPAWLLEDDDDWPLADTPDEPPAKAPEETWALADDVAKRLGIGQQEQPRPTAPPAPSAVPAVPAPRPAAPQQPAPPVVERPMATAPKPAAPKPSAPAAPPPRAPASRPPAAARPAAPAPQAAAPQKPVTPPAERPAVAAPKPAASQPAQERPAAQPPAPKRPAARTALAADRPDMRPPAPQRPAPQPARPGPSSSDRPAADRPIADRPAVAAPPPSRPQPQVNGAARPAAPVPERPAAPQRSSLPKRPAVPRPGPVPRTPPPVTPSGPRPRSEAPLRPQAADTVPRMPSLTTGTEPRALPTLDRATGVPTRKPAPAPVPQPPVREAAPETVPQVPLSREQRADLAPPLPSRTRPKVAPAAPRIMPVKPAVPKPAPIGARDEDDKPPPLRPGMVKGTRTGWAFVIPDTDEKKG